MCPQTPCLFRHATGDIQFVLVVDDFAIKWKHEADLGHLLAALRTVYPLTVDLIGTRYLGMSIDYNRDARTLSISMPNYVTKALNQFDAHDFPLAYSPLLYTPPHYGSSKQQRAIPEDSSPLISPDRKRRIQQIIGTLLYYARAVDPTMLVAVNRIASQQARPTAAVEQAANRLLQYAKARPNATIVYHPSDMRLIVHSDAAHNGETKGRSRAGGYMYLGSHDDADKTVNGHVYCFSTIFDVVVGSAAEAEYGALYLNAQDAESLRNTLSDLGYPQGPTPIICDNSCAVGITNNKLKQKRSKAFDMRFHWIRDRVKQGHFIVRWEPGIINLADLLTKAHSAIHHKRIRPFYVSDPHSTQ